jgi:hypothetical protein
MNEPQPSAAVLGAIPSPPASSKTVGQLELELSEARAEIAKLKKQNAALSKDVADTKKAREKLRDLNTQLEASREDARAASRKHKADTASLKQHLKDDESTSKQDHDIKEKRWEEENVQRNQVIVFLRQQVNEALRSNFLKRTTPEAYPPAYQTQDLQDNWDHHWMTLKCFSPISKLSPDEPQVPESGLPANLEALLCQVGGFPLPENPGTIKVSEVFGGLPNAPANSDLVKALFSARVLQWCSRPAMMWVKLLRSGLQGSMRR